MLIKEFRIVLPVTVEEYQVGQLYSVADASKNETGGGEGIEIKANEPYVDKPIFHGEYSAGQYTHKIYHLASKVPKWVRVLAPKGSLEFKEEAWNAYPYCKTVVTNPEYMKDKFQISIETMHLADRGETENAHRLTEDELKKREVIYIDIANDPVRSGDYKADEDPTKFKSEKSGRGPLTGRWKDTTTPVMCAYKLVRCEFIWFGLQGRVEKFIMNGERRIFTNFHRQVFCWMDKWLGMTMEEIRELEERNKIELDEDMYWRMFTNFHRKLYCLMDNWLGMTMEEIRVLEERNKIELAQPRKLRVAFPCRIGKAINAGEVRGTIA